MLKITFALLALVFIFAFAEDKKIEGPVIGIDLGTTYSCVGHWKDGKVEIIPNELGNRITPSVVSFAPNGGHMVGEAAKNNIAFNPKNTFYDVKRLIGRKFTEVQKVDKDLFTFDLVDSDGRAFVKAEVGNETKIFSPEQISAMILTKMKNIAEAHLNQKVQYAVITVPAYFNDAQKQATMDAGKIAGLEVIRIIAEPTAASMAYGLYQKKEQDIIVFDLGGGTFDVSLLTIDDGTFQVRATHGDMHLGGEDFDLRVVEYFAKLIKEKHGADADIFKNKKSFQKLKQAVEKAKRILSSELETNIEIEALINGIDFNQKLTRAKFEELNKDLFAKTLNPIKQVLADTKLEKGDIDVVVMVGGSTRIPRVKELVSQFFDGKKLETGVNPDEAIAFGATVQGAVIKGDAGSEITIMDITPLSLGIETVGGVMSKIIYRNTPIPTEKFDIFTTTEDYQTQLVIPIYEGERHLTRFNRLLGELTLTDIPAARKGHPQIKVSFNLDKNGVLKVTAEDTNTKNKREVEIKKGFLTTEQINEMVEDAEKNKAEDEEYKKASETRVRLETYLETVKNQLANKNIANRIKSKDKRKIMEARAEVAEWLSKSEMATKTELLNKIDGLKKIVQPILARLTGEQPDVPEEETKEEIKEKKEEKKNTIEVGKDEL